jgi:hypothetical protein
MVLKTALDDLELEDEEREDWKLVLDTVVCAQGPLTAGALSALLKLPNEQVRSALEPLWSVLHMVGTSELVTTLHASFPDFMFDKSRSNTYHCDAVAHNILLAQLCFDCTQSTKRQFNICELESSYVLDEDVADLEKRVQEAIPMELFYACRYWTAHLRSSNGATELSKGLEEFLSTRLLLWMEVMNLKKEMTAGVGMMRLVEEWGMVSTLADRNSNANLWSIDRTVRMN